MEAHIVPKLLFVLPCLLRFPTPSLAVQLVRHLLALTLLYLMTARSLRPRQQFVQGIVASLVAFIEHTTMPLSSSHWLLPVPHTLVLRSFIPFH